MITAYSFTITWQFALFNIVVAALEVVLFPPPSAKNYNPDISRKRSRSLTFDNVDNMKPLAKTPGMQTPALGSNDRFFVLQRKLEDLERIHDEAKRTHQVEVSRLKIELTGSQKSNTELKERLGKQTKQGTALEQRLETLKKEAVADKAEIKSLATQLRLSENQRAQANAKQDEVKELKKALNAAEVKRKDELKDKDRKLAELDKRVKVERQKYDAVVEQLAKKDQEIGTLGDSVRMLKAEVMQARDEVEEARTRSRDLEEEVSSKDLILLQERDSQHLVLETVAREFGTLVEGARSQYGQLQLDHASLQLQLLRVQRKLANSEAQVWELVHLVRQTADDHRILKACLRDSEAQIQFNLLNTPLHTGEEGSIDISDSLYKDLTLASEGIRESSDDYFTAKLDVLEQEKYLLELSQQNTLQAYLFSSEELYNLRIISDGQEKGIREAKVRLDEEKHQRSVAEELFKTATGVASELRASLEVFKRHAAELAMKLEEEGRHAKSNIEKEKANVQRLSSMVQKGKMVEEGLRAEVDQLTAELIDAERFQEAYYNLHDQLGTLSARNALAEEETQKLSAFNAEIIGHHNPAQRILYVERIRSELAETKQKLITSTRTHEADVVLNEELQQELNMYKSIQISDNRPKTTMIRVGRSPLTDLNLSQAWREDDSDKGHSIASKEMTVEEIMY